MAEFPWDMTPAQQKQFREAQAKRQHEPARPGHDICVACGSGRAQLSRALDGNQYCTNIRQCRKRERAATRRNP